MLDRKNTKPKTRKDLEAAGYKFDQADEEGLPPAKCRGCDAEILWARTPRGNRMPFDVGTFEVHWVTCPEAQQFRKPKMGKTPTKRT
jgi:hypothetical protein